MLTAAERELVAAAADGDLPPPAGPAFRALVARSAEALALYTALTAQVRRLAALPKHPAPAEVWRAVMAEVAATPRAVPATRVRPARVSGWRVPVAVAAGLACVGSAGLVVSITDAKHRPAVVTEVRPRGGPPVKPADPKPVPPVVIAEAPPAPVEVAPPPRSRADVAVLPPVEVAPAPRVRVEPDVVGGVTFAPPAAFVTVTVRLPLLVPATDLGRADVQNRVVAELGRDAAFRLDLFAADPARAADPVLTAVRAAGLTVAVDATLTERWKARQPVAWAVYTESLTAAEVAALCGLIAGQASPGAIGPAHLFPAGPADGKDLVQLLGVDRGVGRRPKPAGRPISVATAAQVAAAVTKAGRPAVAVPFGPASTRVTPAVSPEIQAFVRKLTDLRPGAVPLLIVVRPHG